MLLASPHRTVLTTPLLMAIISNGTGFCNRFLLDKNRDVSENVTFLGLRGKVRQDGVLSNENLNVAQYNGNIHQ